MKKTTRRSSSHNIEKGLVHVETLQKQFGKSKLRKDIQKAAKELGISEQTVLRMVVG